MVKQQEMSSLKSASSPTDHSSGGVKFRGVRKRKWGKYVSEIRLPNSRERIWLGSYDTPEKAARAFDAALFCLRGNTAKFNFPDQPPHIPGGRSLLPSQIQAAAARFANHNSDIKSSSVKCPTTTTTTTDDNSSNSSSSCNSSEEEDSPSLCMFQLTDLSETWTSTFLENDLTSSSSSYMNIIDTDIITNTDIGVPDFEIFPGFDDYLMTTLPTTDYGEENCDGVYLQDPSFLWNF